MARPRLSRPDQPWHVRVPLKIYEFLASLKLAVLLILSMAGVLAFATFVESKFGSAGVQHYIYFSWWFIAGQVLLGLNIFCAAAIRYPWKRHQTGFVITHIGLLVLLAGSALSYRDSVDAQMRIGEGNSSRSALDRDEMVITLTNLPGNPETVRVPFEGGPFNWGSAPFKNTTKQFFDRFGITRGWMNLLGVDVSQTEYPFEPQVLYEDDQTKVEAIDFYAAAENLRLPHLSLQFYNPLVNQTMEQKLGITTYKINGEERLAFGRDSFGQMGQIAFWPVESDHEVDLFLKASRGGQVSPSGAVRVWLDDAEEGERLVTVSIERLRKTTFGKPYKLPGGRTLELVTFEERYIPIVSEELLKEYPWIDNVAGRTSLGPFADLVLKDGEKSYRIKRLADHPYAVTNTTDDIRVEFFHPSASGRIDVILGPDNRLAYRTWQSRARTLPGSGEIPLMRDTRSGFLRGTSRVSTWSMGGQQADGTNAAWEMLVTRLIIDSDMAITHAETDEEAIGWSENLELATDIVERTKSMRLLPRKLPFVKDRETNAPFFRRLKIRVSSKIDGEWHPVDTRWVFQSFPRDVHWRKGVQLAYLREMGMDHPWVENHVAEVDLPHDDSEKPLTIHFASRETDLGIAMKLVDFEIQQDPGSSMASDYFSWLAVVDVRDEPEVRTAQEKIDDADTPVEREAARIAYSRTVNDSLSAKLLEIDRQDYDTLDELAEKEEWLATHAIHMNVPLDHPDMTDRTLRFFQEQALFPIDNLRRYGSSPAATVLRVNYDPGRWVKYLGSALISLGIFMMFYMRAYFFKKPNQPAERKPVPWKKKSGRKPAAPQVDSDDSEDEITADDYAFLSSGSDS